MNNRGSGLWERLVGATCGSDLWERACGSGLWERACGSGLWERLVEATCGSDLWERLVGATCGSGFSRDSFFFAAEAAPTSRSYSRLRLVY